MTLRPFIIDNEMKSKLKKLAKHAEENPFNEEDLKLIIAGKGPIPGDIKEFFVFLPFGYKIVYTIEKQKPGLIRHLSISVNSKKDKLPNEFVVQSIMDILGFENELKKCFLDLEQVGPKNHAINVLEIIKQPSSKE